MVIIEAPFHRGTIRNGHRKDFMDMKEQAVNMIKLKFLRNKAVLKITNRTHETVTFSMDRNDRSHRLKIVRLSTKLNKRYLQEHLGRHVTTFKLADDMYVNQYNRFVKSYQKRRGKF